MIIKSKSTFKTKVRNLKIKLNFELPTLLQYLQKCASFGRESLNLRV